MVYTEVLRLDTRAATFIPSVELGLIQQTAQSLMWIWKVDPR